MVTAGPDVALQVAKSEVMFAQQDSEEGTLATAQGGQVLGPMVCLLGPPLPLLAWGQRRAQAEFSTSLFGC